MDKTLLIIGDPLDGLNYAGDSSLALAQGGLESGFRIHWALPEHIALLNGEPIVSFLKEVLSVPAGMPPVCGDSQESFPLRLDSYEKILVRKDPPFDDSYTDLCWILSQCAPRKVINSPESLLNLHEKLAPWRMAKDGIVPDHMLVPTLVSRDPNHLSSFVDEQFSLAESFLNSQRNLSEFHNFRFRVLAKPWRGHGGRGVHTFTSRSEFDAWTKTISETRGTRPGLNDLWIVQPLLPEIHTHGDRRVFIVNGKIAFDFVRWPAAGRIEANLAQGGTATLEPLPEELQSVSLTIARILKNQGVLLAGLDFIGSRLTEVNITSPTGIRTFENLSGRKIATKLLSDLLKD